MCVCAASSLNGPAWGKNAVAGGWLAVGGATPQCVPLSTGGLLVFGSVSSDPC